MTDRFQDENAQIRQKCAELSIPLTQHRLHISITHQRLLVFEGETCRHVMTCATGRKPASNVEDSLGTPTGLHHIDEKIGDGEPLGMTFVGRVPQGTCFADLDAQTQARNLITTRILWLRGLEPGINAGVNAHGQVVDTHQRYIYIHGTNHEARLGSPDSHGCVLLSNADVVTLFDTIDSGTVVLIVP